MTAGHDFTVDEIRDTFKEALNEEPNWQKVSSNLGLDLSGQVSVTEFYQAWCKYDPSWEKLSQALEKFDEYQQVANQTKKNTGVGVLYKYYYINVLDYVGKFLL